MDIQFSAKEEAFRSEVREWLEQNAPKGDWRKYSHPHGGAVGDEEEKVLRQWLKTLYDGGWAAVTWPHEYGGRGLSAIEKMIFDQEMARAKVPHNIASIGIDIAGPILMQYGTVEQKDRFLNKMAAGEEIWCQGFSETNAGSDLASLSTRAVEDGDDFIINGSKIWTSFADFSDWCLLLARTDTKAPKHQGITCFAVDLKTPGITIEPLTIMCGTHEFNQVVFDEVRVPRSNVIGPVNQGWDVATKSLSHERNGLSASFVAAYRRYFNEAVEKFLSDPNASSDPVLLQGMVKCYINLEILEWQSYRVVSEIMETGTPPLGATISRLHSCQVSQQVMGWIFDALQPHVAPVNSPEDIKKNAYWHYAFLRVRGNSIAAGTSEIQRNIIARRALGLPTS